MAYGDLIEMLLSQLNSELNCFPHSAVSAKAAHASETIQIGDGKQASQT
jgi:hypothetical protein